MRHGLPAIILLLNTTAAEASRDRFAVCLAVEDPSAVEWSLLTNAKLVAAAILDKGGVELKWSKSRRPAVCATWLIAISFSRHAPDSMPPGAMGYALPYATGTVGVTVLMDRLLPLLARTPNWRGSILGHVIAHEVTHVLQGVVRHSDRGLMKERWSEDDIQRMGIQPLEFTPVDLLLIQRGMLRHVTLGEE
jgi:hypothetical protein